MSSLFEGTPQSSATSSISTTEVPTWMQDAIYNQIQWAQNAANADITPYTTGERQAYEEAAQQMVAPLSPMQMQAYTGVQNAQGAWQPALTEAQTGTMNLARQTAPSQVAAYMNPYQQGVLDVIAKQGARNLTENLLPGVSDAFVRAGQFGSNRMGEFGSRALRDTQEAILNQQAQAAQQGYTQALSAQQADAARQQSALQQAAQMTQQGQQLTYADLAALENAGAAQQYQAQQLANAAYGQFQTNVNYPKTQLDWLSTQVRGLAPIAGSTTTTSGTGTGQTYSASPLSQIASGLGTALGLSKLFS